MHAHQQNGSAKRKHRYIVEVGLTLLAHASMPLKFWDEAFLTAVFLINRLPSKVIENKPPLFRLYGKHPDYAFLTSFGCACWPNIRPYITLRNLSSGRKSVFSCGIATSTKATNVLSLQQDVYVSRDVIFDEHVFPFTSMHPNAGAQLQAKITLLPKVLQNPYTSVRDSYTLDHVVKSPNFTDVSQNTARDLIITGENLDASGSVLRDSRRHFMCRPPGDSTKLEGDQVDKTIAPADESSSPLKEIFLSGATTAIGATAVGSSTVAPSTATTSSTRVATQQDLGDRVVPSSLAGSGVDPSGSAMASPNAATTVPPTSSS
jgi:hypothetical protein